MSHDSNHLITILLANNFYSTFLPSDKGTDYLKKGVRFKYQLK